MAKTNWKKKLLITNNLQQQILGYHVKFKVCLVSKPLIHVVLSNFCKLREKHFFCRLFKRNLEFGFYIMWIIKPRVTVVCLSVQLWLVIQTLLVISCSTSSNNCLLFAGLYSWWTQVFRCSTAKSYHHWIHLFREVYFISWNDSLLLFE